jgi:AcrR family transcriptional regulator
VPPSPTETGSAPQRAPRQRLLDGLAEVLGERAYADLTIADVVAAARVSRRTFYEHFDSKDACLLALCERLSEEVMGVIANGYDPEGDWVQELEKVTAAYLHNLQQRPALVRALYLEMLTLGPKGLAMRRRISERFTQFLMMQVELSRLKEPGKRPLSPALATAVIGGINELIVQAIEEDRADRLVELQPTISEFVQAVLQSLMPDEVGG